MASERHIEHPAASRDGNGWPRLGGWATFAREWLRSPRGVAAVVPSGRVLAALMARDISGETGPVVELGPGTGVFTRALLRRGVREEDLTLVEHGLDFARHLKARFPGARVLRMDAAGIGRRTLFEGSPVGAVVCGLGLLNMPEHTVLAIVGGAFRSLRPGGAFLLFTYGARCSVSQKLLDELGLDAVRVGGTVLNLPPASVYRLTRRGEAA